MGIFDSITDFYKDNKDWIKPVVSTGLGIFKQSNAQDTQSQYLDYLKQREDKNYQDSVNQINDYNARGSAASAASRAAAASRNAAARQTEANRQKAAKKANKKMQDTYKKVLEMYAPYKQTADTLLPQMSQTYQNSLGMQNSMAQYLNSPAQIAKLDAAGPAWNINVPLPDSVRIK